MGDVVHALPVAAALWMYWRRGGFESEEGLLNRDTYMLMADFRSYVDCQDQVGQAWRDVERWSQRIGRAIESDELEPNNATMVKNSKRPTVLIATLPSIVHLLVLIAPVRLVLTTE